MVGHGENKLNISSAVNVVSSKLFASDITIYLPIILQNIHSKSSI